MKRKAESIISKLFTEVLKKVGGRGARNIFVKLNDDSIEIHFTLNKCHLEEFIFKYFYDSDTYLKELNNRIAEIVSNMIKMELEKTFEIKIMSYSYEIDIYSDKYSMFFNKEV